MGFRKLQMKKKYEKISTSETQKHRNITYKLSSFFLNVSTGEQEQTWEREKNKGKNNSYYRQLKLVGLAR